MLARAPPKQGRLGHPMERSRVRPTERLMEYLMVHPTEKSMALSMGPQMEYPMAHPMEKLME